MLLPAWRARAMWVWISRLAPSRWGIMLRVTTGSPRAASGKSHSWVTATSRSPRPSAKTISVALGRSEQMRMAGRAYRPGAGPVEEAEHGRHDSPRRLLLRSGGQSARGGGAGARHAPAGGGESPGLLG